MTQFQIIITVNHRSENSSSDRSLNTLHRITLFRQLTEKWSSCGYICTDCMSLLSFMPLINIWVPVTTASFHAILLLFELSYSTVMFRWSHVIITFKAAFTGLYCLMAIVYGLLTNLHGFIKILSLSYVTYFNFYTFVTFGNNGLFAYVE